ncbi:hypothetical protein N0O92_03505 [Alkalihalobacillus sp. MEB130]|uniref:hypothetical protein n=1 Tax=Alkalihalobacillus sp. MEB130 TaxID=2976704 RepID=UPI0028DE508A|nr:hypothetical protein [Alkalihalobacillus sp. MEB130]MDT8859286.1 hypothetical protein [Alkalihalobacillus sp. MEB130]
MLESQRLLSSIFMCGEQEVKNITETFAITYVVDLRAEATSGVIQSSNIEWIHFPLLDGVPNQADVLKEAISFVSQAHKKGKTTVLH